MMPFSPIRASERDGVKMKLKRKWMQLTPRTPRRGHLVYQGVNHTMSVVSAFLTKQCWYRCKHQRSNPRDTGLRRTYLECVTAVQRGFRNTDGTGSQERHVGGLFDVQLGPSTSAHDRRPTAFKMLNSRNQCVLLCRCSADLLGHQAGNVHHSYHMCMRHTTAR